MITYFDVDGYPGKYFSCAKYGTMSVSACAKNFVAAPESVKKGRLAACVGCTAGAGHAGVKPAVVAAQPVDMVYREACLRCRRSGSDDSSRLIGRMRLVRGHTICVSCYNREREVIHGANAKGAVPKKWSKLFSFDAAYAKGNAVVRSVLAAPVVDPIEAALTVLRLNKAGGVVWARPILLRNNCTEAMC